MLAGLDEELQAPMGLAPLALHHAAQEGRPSGEADLGSAGTETVDSQLLLLFSKNLNGSSFTFFKRKKQVQDNLGSLSRVWPYPTASGCRDNDPLNLSQFPRDLVY